MNVMSKATKKPSMTFDQLKKENHLLVFMLLNHKTPPSPPFNFRRDGCEFIRLKGTKDHRSLQSILQVLKQKQLVMNGSHGNWLLTPAGLVEAEYWLSKCGSRSAKEIAATTKSMESCGSIENLEKKLANLEAELDGLRCDLTMATHTNQYLDERNTELWKENMSLKKKLEMIQRVLNK